jgi:hypothetical protein
MRGVKGSGIKVICPCGKKFTTIPSRIAIGRGIYCCKACMYKYSIRPNGLKYEKHKENPTSFKKGHISWSTGLAGTGICKPTSGSIKKGERRGVTTEFKGETTQDEKNVNWKGDDVGYYALHTYISRKLGNANHCEWCGDTNCTRYVWHNKSGKYTRDLDDWISLCPSCHIGYHYKLKKDKK